MEKQMKEEKTSARISKCETLSWTSLRSLYMKALNFNIPNKELVDFLPAYSVHHRQMSGSTDTIAFTDIDLWL